MAKGYTVTVIYPHLSNNWEYGDNAHTSREQAIEAFYMHVALAEKANVQTDMIILYHSDTDNGPYVAIKKWTPNTGAKDVNMPQAD